MCLLGWPPSLLIVFISRQWNCAKYEIPRAWYSRRMMQVFHIAVLCTLGYSFEKMNDAGIMWVAGKGGRYCVEGSESGVIAGGALGEGLGLT